MPLFAADLL